MQIPDARLRQVLEAVPEEWELRDGLRPAAVLAPVLAREAGDVLVLTRRRMDMPTHAGQISFPGGAREGAEDPARCALRETEEEIGVAAARVTLLGSLPKRRSTSGYLVHACVGRIVPPAGFTLEAREVEAIVEIPLADLAVLDRWRFLAPSRGGRTYPVSPHFEWRGELVWGLTGRLVYDLVTALVR